MTQGRKLLTKEEKEFRATVKKTYLNELNEQEMCKVVKCIQRQLHNNINEMTKIQKLIFVDCRLWISTRQIRQLVKEIRNFQEINAVLSKYTEEGQGTKTIKKTSEELSKTLLTKGTIKLNHEYLNDMILQSGYDRYKKENEEQTQFLNNLIGELQKIKDRDDKPTSQERFAIESMLTITDLKTKITANQIKISSEKIKSIMDGIRTGILMLEAEEKQKQKNACEDIAISNIEKFIDNK